MGSKLDKCFKQFKKAGLFTIVFLNVCSYGLKASESSKIDSLKHILSKYVHDTIRVKALIELAQEQYMSSPQDAIKWCEEARQLSEKINYVNGIVNAYGWLAFLNEQQGNISKALNYYQKALKLSEKRKDKKDQATILNNIAAILKDQGQINEAILYHNKSLKLRKEINDQEGIATSYNNIALIFSNQGKIPEAINYFMLSLQIYEEVNDSVGIATALHNIASVYREQHDFEKALDYMKRAKMIEEKQHDFYDLGYALNLIGGLYEDMGNLDSALNNYNQSYNIRSKINDHQGMAYSLKNEGNVFLKMGNYADAERTLLNSLNAFETLGDKSGVAITTNLIGSVFLKKGQLAAAEKYLTRSFKLANELGYPASISAAAGNLQQLYREKGQWQQALLMNDVFVSMRDSIQSDMNRKSAIKSQFQYEYEKKEAIVKSEAKAEVSKQKLIRNGFVSGFVIVLLFAAVFFIQRNKISKEKNRSDELLLNILPSEVAIELKDKGTANAKQYDQVTVLFTDFKNFTSVAENLTAQELVNEINFCYSAFDRIISKYSIEKIKTIGDAYMCAGGLPVPNSTNAIDIVLAALEIRDFMLNEKQKREISGSSFFEIRIGCHTGPVVAGIVGIKKFAYDIWGDTVNIASRMESSGESGKVNISGTTFELVKHQFSCTYRGKVQAKNKGEIDMYFVNNRLTA
jgi:class 3 adenylate cyclase/Tfp pilus assembly protein PilF